MNPTFKIKQPSIFRNTYYVYDGESLVGSLAMKGIIKKRGQATIHDQAFQFTPNNAFVSNSTLVSNSASNELLAISTTVSLLNKETVEIAGKTYNYATTADEASSHKLVKPMVYTWSDANKNNILTIRRTAFLRFNGTATVFSKTIHDEEYLLLVLLVLYRQSLTPGTA